MKNKLNIPVIKASLCISRVSDCIAIESNKNRFYYNRFIGYTSFRISNKQLNEIFIRSKFGISLKITHFKKYINE